MSVCHLDSDTANWTPSIDTTDDVNAAIPYMTPPLTNPPHGHRQLCLVPLALVIVDLDHQVEGVLNVSIELIPYIGVSRWIDGPEQTGELSNFFF